MKNYWSEIEKRLIKICSCFAVAGGAEKVRRRTAATIEIARTGACRSSSGNDYVEGRRSGEKSSTCAQRAIRAGQYKTQGTTCSCHWKATWGWSCV